MAAMNVKHAVQYIGTADSRIITKGDWGSMGIEQDDTAWDASNGLTIPSSSLSAEALRFLEDNGSEWAIVEDTPQHDPNQLELEVEAEA